MQLLTVPKLPHTQHLSFLLLQPRFPSATPMHCTHPPCPRSGSSGSSRISHSRLEEAQLFEDITDDKDVEPPYMVRNRHPPLAAVHCPSPCFVLLTLLPAPPGPLYPAPSSQADLKTALL